MIEANKYFSTAERMSVFDRATAKLRSTIDDLPENYDARQRFMLDFVGTLFHSISRAPDLFDERCPMNIDALGDRYVSSANSISKGDMQDLEFIFSTSYRFAIEYQLASKADLPSHLSQLVGRVHDFQYDGITTSQLKYAEHQMIVNVLQRYLHHPDMVDVRALPDAMKRSESMRDQYEAELKSREERAQELKNKLDSYKTAFNFVGLYDGFKSLRRKKGVEAWWGFVYLIVLGVLMLTPFLIKFYSAIYSLVYVNMDTAFYVSLLGFELLLAYFLGSLFKAISQ